MAVRRFYVHTVTSSSRPFHIAAAVDLGMVEHLLHLYNSSIQFIDGNKATTYNSLQKNITEIIFFLLHLLCVHAVHFSFHNNFQYIHI